MFVTSFQVSESLPLTCKPLIAKIALLCSKIIVLHGFSICWPFPLYHHQLFLSLFQVGVVTCLVVPFGELIRVELTHMRFQIALVVEFAVAVLAHTKLFYQVLMLFLMVLLLF